MTLDSALTLNGLFPILSYCIFSLLSISDLDDPEGIAYDWVNKRLFFTDYYSRDIQSMGVDGKNRSIVAHGNRPRGIIVDPCYG